MIMNIEKKFVRIFKSLIERPIIIKLTNLMTDECKIPDILEHRYIKRVLLAFNSGLKLIPFTWTWSNTILPK